MGLYIAKIEDHYEHDESKMKIVHAYFGLIDSVIDDVIRVKVKSAQKAPFSVYSKLFTDLFYLAAKKNLPNVWNDDQKKKIADGIMVVTELAKDLFVVEEKYDSYERFVQEVIKVSAEILYYEVYTQQKV